MIEKCGMNSINNNMHYIGLIILFVIVCIVFLYYIKMSAESKEKIIEKYNSGGACVPIAYASTNNASPIIHNFSPPADRVINGGDRSVYDNSKKPFPTQAFAEMSKEKITQDTPVNRSSYTMRDCQIHFNNTQNGKDIYKYEDGWKEIDTIIGEDKSVFNVPFKQFGVDGNNLADFTNFNEIAKCYKRMSSDQNNNPEPISYKYKSNNLIKYNTDKFIMATIKDTNNEISGGLFVEMNFDKKESNNHREYNSEFIDSICSYKYRENFNLDNTGLYRLKLNDDSISVVEYIEIDSADNNKFKILKQSLLTSRLPELLDGNTSFLYVENNLVHYTVQISTRPSEQSLLQKGIDIYKFTRNLKCGTEGRSDLSSERYQYTEKNEAITCYKIFNNNLYIVSHKIVSSLPYTSRAISTINISDFQIPFNIDKSKNGFSRSQIEIYLNEFIKNSIVKLNMGVIKTIEAKKIELEKAVNDIKNYKERFNTFHKFINIFKDKGDNRGTDHDSIIVDTIAGVKNTINGNLGIKKNTIRIDNYVVLPPTPKKEPPLTIENVYDIKTYTINTIDKTFTLDEDTICDILVVAGGGGGGSVIGGGGGAGGLIYRRVTMRKGSYTIIVGNGGHGASGSYRAVPGKGGNSSILYNLPNIFSMIAEGGGGGGWRTEEGETSAVSNRTGGSGGGNSPNGGSVSNTVGSGGITNCLLIENNTRTEIIGGNPGAITLPGGRWLGYGGGGAGGIGGGFEGFLTAPQDGGPGREISISGEAKYYAGGGGGGMIGVDQYRSDRGVGGLGGSGIGGNGKLVGHHSSRTLRPDKSDIHAVPDTGSGGGGGGYPYGHNSTGGGNGSSGIVIIRYLKKPIIHENMIEYTIENKNKSSAQIITQNTDVKIKINDSSILSLLKNSIYSVITSADQRLNIYHMFNFISNNIITFNTSQTYTFDEDFTCDILVVGGGGGGGQNSGGGGGAGGLILLQNFQMPKGTITINIGVGGEGGKTMNVGTVASKGGNSSIIIGNNNPIIAYGGGGGFNSGGYDSLNNNGSDGGSGGGAGESSHDFLGKRWGGKGIVNQGNNGGNGIFAGGWQRTGGGGGGAGSAGGTPISVDIGGNGGIGKDLTNFFGNNVGHNGWFAGGGGGSSHYNGQGLNGLGGKGGGGNASWNSQLCAAIQNTGGGGGASRGHHVVGGLGGSGIVIIKKTSRRIYQNNNAEKLKIQIDHGNDKDEDLRKAKDNNASISSNNYNIGTTQEEILIGHKSSSEVFKRFRIVINALTIASGATESYVTKKERTSSAANAIAITDYEIISSNVDNTELSNRKTIDIVFKEGVTGYIYINCSNDYSCIYSYKDEENNRIPTARIYGTAFTNTINQYNSIIDEKFKLGEISSQKSEEEKGLVKEAVGTNLLSSPSRTTTNPLEPGIFNKANNAITLKNNIDTFFKSIHTNNTMPVTALNSNLKISEVIKNFNKDEHISYENVDNANRTAPKYSEEHDVKKHADKYVYFKLR